MNPQSEYEIEDALAHMIDERDCLLPDDDTAVERLAAALWMYADSALAIRNRDKTGARKTAELLIAALREGGPRANHSQECVDAYYGDGGQSGCICGADRLREGGQRE